MDGQIESKCTQQFIICHIVGSSRIKICFWWTNNVKFMKYNIRFQKKWFRIVMGRYTVEIPVVDWEIFFAILSKTLDLFQHHHLTLIKGCKHILECAHQYCGTENTEHRILRWISKRYPLIQIKSRKKRRMLIKNSQNHSWKNYLTYPNIMTRHSVNV